MFAHFSEQMKNSSRPASELLAANVKAMEAVAKQQSQFFTGLIDDSVKLMQTIAQQTEMKDVLAAQAVYAESLTERLSSSSAVAYNTISVVSQQYIDALKSGFEPAAEAGKKTVKTAPLKALPTKKVGVKTESISTETSVADKPNTVTAKTTSKTKPASNVIAKKPDTNMATQKQPAAKSAAMPLAKPRSEEVKTPSITKTTELTAAADNKSSPATKA